MDKMEKIIEYFKHIKDKTYINRYPETIIKLSDIKGRLFVEFGCGIGNDAKWLLNKGLCSKGSFFVEIHPYAFSKSATRLKSSGCNVMQKDIINTGLKNDFVDYIYANNVLLCLKSKEDIKSCLKEAFRILKDGGVLFGRTTNGKVNKEKLKAILTPKDEKEAFALRTTKRLLEGDLLGMSDTELKELAKEVGFSKVYTELRPEKKWKPTQVFYFKFEK